MKSSKPNFFIVGAAKCGTTALYTYLLEHPQIFMPSVKEPGFFAADIMGDRRRIKTMQEYLSLFEAVTNEERIGEASTAYFVSSTAPMELKAFAPDAKIIVMLRNPIDKMYARFSEARLANQEHSISFEAALEAEKNLGPSSGLGYWESARYVDKVRRYFAIFGRENVHVIIYDDFVRNPSKIYEEVLHFLNVHSNGRTVFPVVNSNHRVRIMVLQELLRHPPKFVRKAVVSVLPFSLRERLRTLLLKFNVIYEPRPPMNPELRKQLRREFQEEIEQLGVLLGRNLSMWLHT